MFTIAIIKIVNERVFIAEICERSLRMSFKFYFTLTDIYEFCIDLLMHFVDTFQ